MSGVTYWARRLLERRYPGVPLEQLARGASTHEERGLARALVQTDERRTRSRAHPCTASSEGGAPTEAHP